PSLRGAIERGGRTAALCLVRPFFYHSRPQPRRNSPLKFAVRPGSAQSVGILPLSPPKPVSAFPLTNRQNANTNPANTSTATHSANPPAHAVPILHGACPRDTAQPAAAAITTPSNPSPPTSPDPNSTPRSRRASRSSSDPALRSIAPRNSPPRNTGTMVATGR